MIVAPKDIILFEDSFNVQHVGRVTTITDSKFREKPEPRNLGVIVLLSIEESSLNTGNITEDEVIMVFKDCNNIDEVEDKYPEVWI